ncbi:MAG: DUF3426 domain-containing protein, partial [Alphaproteobacteria bacterium]|nr:DUF3426 domain-containing protein [Alphaproteobacteria bacterium]
RFDDNTPLPDDFDHGKEVARTPPQPKETEVSESAQAHVEPQVDLLFGEPDEWEDLLDEVGDAASDDEIEAETATADETPAIEEANAVASDPSTKSEPAADSDLPLDMDTQFQLQAEAMGVDLSGIHGSEVAETDVADAATEVAAIDPGDTSIEEDLIAAAFQAEAEARKEVSAAEELLEELAEEAEAEKLDIDAQLAELKAYAPDAESEQEVEELELEDSAAVAELEFEEPDEDEDDDEDDLIDDLHVEQELAIEAELQEIDSVHTDKTVAAPLTEPEQGDLDAPEMSEEEMTINKMIDQDLLAIAVEDDDGFTSTIVEKQVSKEDESGEASNAADVDEEDIDKAAGDVASPFQIPAKSPIVETIIMEGETFHGEIDLEKEAEKASFMEEAKSNIASQFSKEPSDRQPMSTGLIIAAIMLVLLLVGQYIHQSRETLATIPAFNSSIGSLYRSIGQPVTPAWNVSGWRFEATKGDIGDGEDLLTIYSRVGNYSDRALPYPLIHVALTDRFEEIIGSKVLEPAEYLAGDPDPRKAVAPGDNFDAAIAIETPSLEATGFRLDVCYRIASRQLRCAIEDFK